MLALRSLCEYGTALFIVKLSALGTSQSLGGLIQELGKRLIVQLTFKVRQ